MTDASTGGEGKAAGGAARGFGRSLQAAQLPPSKPTHPAATLHPLQQGGKQEIGERAPGIYLEGPQCHLVRPLESHVGRRKRCLHATVQSTPSRIHGGSSQQRIHREAASGETKKGGAQEESTSLTVLDINGWVYHALNTRLNYLNRCVL